MVAAVLEMSKFCWLMHLNKLNLHKEDAWATTVDTLENVSGSL